MNWAESVPLFVSSIRGREVALLRIFFSCILLPILFIAGEKMKKSRNTRHMEVTSLNFYRLWNFDGRHDVTKPRLNYGISTLYSKNGSNNCNWVNEEYPAKAE